MNRRYLGVNGHIGIATRSMERAIDDMEKRGFSLDMDTAKYSGERIKTVYLKNEIGRLCRSSDAEITGAER